MTSGFGDWGRPAECANGIDQFGGRIGCAAFAAVIAILVFGFAVWTSTFDEPIGQKCSCNRIKQLLNIPFRDQVRGSQRLPDLFAKFIVFSGVRAAVVIETDAESGKVPFVGRLHVGN